MTLTLADAQTCDVRQIGLAGGRENGRSHDTRRPDGHRRSGRGSPTGSGLRPRTACSRSDRRPRQPEPGASSAATGLSSASSSGARTAAHRLVRPPAHRLRPRGRRPCDPAPALPRRLHTRQPGRIRSRQSGACRRSPRLHRGRRHHVCEVRARRVARGRRGRAERWDGSLLTSSTKLTPSQGITPIFSNDNCAALLP